MPETSSFDEIPTKVPKSTEFKKWLGGEMHARNGLEAKKKGLFVEVWIDAKGWERKLWRAPDYRGKVKLENMMTMKSRDKGKSARKDSSAFVDKDS